MTSPIEIKKINKIIESLDYNDPMKYIFSIGANTGLRVGDIKQIRWEDVKGKKVFSLTEKKTGKPRIIYINSFLFKILNNKANQYKTGQIVTFSTYTINKKIKLILFDHKLDFAHQSSHFLRKSFATKIYNETKDILLVKELLNHASVSTTQRYLRACNIDVNIYNLINK